MREYELTVILHPDLEIDLDKANGKIKQVIADNGGTIVKEDNWGKRRLSYPIRKENFGIYVYYELQLPAQVVKKINDTLNITDEVLRFLLVTSDPRAKLAAEAAAEAEAKEAEAKEESKESEE
jgi:small subunit ribosomal protein S6